jgi:hypothetical protein
MVCKLSETEHNQGCLSRIRILTFSHPGCRIQGPERHRIPDPGSRIQDPGYRILDPGSATLFFYVRTNPSGAGSCGLGVFLK